MIEVERKTGTQRLADTLKRAGIASSIHDAHRMAKDISETEKKVQVHFDKKSEELKEEMIKRVHGVKEVHKQDGGDEEDMKDHRQEIFNGMVERARSPQPVRIQTDFETPQNSSGVSETEDEDDPDLAGEKDVLQSDRPLREIAQEQEAEEKEDYINRYMENQAPEREEESKIEVAAAEEKEEQKIVDTEPRMDTAGTLLQEQLPQQTEEIREQKSESQPVQQSLASAQQEQKIDIHDYFNHAKKDMSPSEKLGMKKEAEKPQQALRIPAQPKAASHPKTGDNQKIDINDYFNFAKRGKL